MNEVLSRKTLFEVRRTSLFSCNVVKSILADFYSDLIFLCYFLFIKKKKVNKFFQNEGSYLFTFHYSTAFGNFVFINLFTNDTNVS